MTDPAEHQAQRELLGAYALGALPDDERAGVRAHLDGCATCRAELAEIAPLAADLRAVDLTRMTHEPAPPADLGDRIRSAVAAEQRLVHARTALAARRPSRLPRSRRAVLVAAAAVLVAGAVGGGVLVGRAQIDPAAPPRVPVEALRLVPVGGADLSVQQAGLVPHTWGVEVRMVASGFDDGAVYRAAFRAADGSMLPAGEFLGTGDGAVTCNLQAALLRPETTTFVIMSAEGEPVLTADLPAAS